MFNHLNYFVLVLIGICECLQIRPTILQFYAVCIKFNVVSQFLIITVGFVCIHICI